MTSPRDYSSDSEFDRNRNDSLSHAADTHEDALVENLIALAVEEERERHPHRELKRVDQIRIAIGVCKRTLRKQSESGCETTGENGAVEETEELSHEMRKVLVDKLVQLGLERQSLEDPSLLPPEQVKKCNGHEFALQSARGRNPCCEVCMSTIWRLVQSWRRCRACGLRAHDKCSAETRRECAAVVGLHPDFQYSTKISDEKGLTAQDYKCAECELPLAFEGSPTSEPRICGLTGLYYCSQCHWNDEWPIPARLMHNMDPTPYPVSRAAKQLLAVTQFKPLINMLELNPRIFALHSGLKKVQRCRKDFLIMKCYFVSCKGARSLRILQYLRNHQHFVEDSKLYTLDELKEIAAGRLARELEDIHTVFRRHIEDECETCRGNGFYCELCETEAGRNQILFPFSDGVSMCKKCFFVFHKSCFERVGYECPRCARREKRECR